MTDAVIEFAKWVIREGAFQAADLDGLSIQEKAHELGLINRTTYNPKKHGPSDCAEPGGEWFVFSPLLSALQPDESTDLTGAHAVGEEGEEKKGREAVEDAVTWTGLLETLADSSFVSGSRAATLRAIAEHLRHSRPSEQAVTEAWRPIETAPKDGTRILAWTPAGHDIVWWSDLEPDGPEEPGHNPGWWGACGETAPGRTPEHGFGGNPTHHWPAQNQPTHWMPLPTPPTAGGGDE